MRFSFILIIPHCTIRILWFRNPSPITAHILINSVIGEELLPIPLHLLCKVLLSPSEDTSLVRKRGLIPILFTPFIRSRVSLYVRVIVRVNLTLSYAIKLFIILEFSME